jgi:hypothetical protein
MSDTSTTRLVPRHRFRGTLAGDGRPGPIEERIGRRLVRLVDPQSPEGLRLLVEGSVDLVGPEGDLLGQISLHEAYARLLERLERRLADDVDHKSRGDLEEGRTRLLAWSRRFTGTAGD